MDVIRLRRRATPARSGARAPGPTLWLLLLLAVPGGAAGAGVQSAKSLYESAGRAEKTLRGSPAAMADRDAWRRAARGYREVVLAFPRSGYCDDALYYEGGLYRDAADRFGDPALARRASDAYRLLADGYPSSKWAPAALLERVRLHAGVLGEPNEARRAANRLAEAAPGSDAVKLAAAALAPPPPPDARESGSAASGGAEAKGAKPPSPPGGDAGPDRQPAEVRGIRHWVGKERTRVVMDLSRKVRYREGRLEGPDRVFFDLFGASLSPELASRTFPIEGSHLQRIRVGNFEQEVVRVVLDFSRIQEVTVFPLPDPYRLVVDIHGDAPPAPTDAATPSVVSPAKTAEAGLTGGPSGSPARPAGGNAAKAESSGASDELRTGALPSEDGLSLARQLGAGVRRIVVDAGHGGKDPGTRSGSLYEKDIALDIARKLRDILVERGYEVVMTRDSDVFIPLEKRAFVANDVRADLFLSIHVNAARNRRSRGLETYYLNLATSPDAEAVAARENASTGSLGWAEIRPLVDRILTNAKVVESRQAAEAIQHAMAVEMLGKAGHSLDRGVKTAGFHVLIGADMPAILAEVGFLSNPDEKKLLEAADHRTKIARALAGGVDRYAEAFSTTTAAAGGGAGGAERPPAGPSR